MKKILLIVLAGLLLLPPAGAVSVLDTPLRDKLTFSLREYDFNPLSGAAYYDSVLSQWIAAGHKSGGDKIRLEGSDMRFSAQPQTVEYAGREGALWTSGADSVTFSADIRTPGLYMLNVEYAMPSGCDYTAVRSLLLDGEATYFEMRNIQFTGLWHDVGEIRTNTLGNEIWPKQEPVGSWQSKTIRDGYALYAEPLAFYLEAGTREFTFEFVTGNMVLGAVSVVPYALPPSYAEVLEGYLSMGHQEVSPGSAIAFEAESNLSSKSDMTMRIESDADPQTFPRAVTSRKRNVFGGYRWRNAGQEATWTFSVPESGLYQIGVRAVQGWNDGLPSVRRVSIDGEVPFAELMGYSFPFNTEWTTGFLCGADGEPFLFYLSAGEHTISLETCFANIGDVIRGLNRDMTLLSKIIRDITKITTADPDPNYDYRLFTVVPTLQEDLTALKASLELHYETVSALASKKPAIANNFLTIISQLDTMLERPFYIPRKLTDLDNALNSLGTWYTELQSQPLMIDTFYVTEPGHVLPKRTSNIFSRLWGTILNLLLSFTKDYDNVGNLLDEGVEVLDTIEVWVARGTEWAELIAELADQTFTPESGVSIKLNILPPGQLNAGSVNALMLSIASGTSPDVVMGAEWTSPVEFAIRDAVLDLTQFDSFEDVRGRFFQEIFTPYTYRGGVYALPETMDFNVMFYRKDILSDLGIPLPNTRREIYDHILPALYQNHLNAFIPADFSTYLYQRGGNYYTDDGLRTALDTPEAYQAMKEMAELFTVYGIPVSANFFNRFRSGEMPIGVGNFTLYTQFTIAAPEIIGKWGIAPLPGILRDGAIDRSAGGLVGQCDMIMATTQKPEASWKFLDWWTSMETQSRYAREIESLVGLEARWNTANIEAFKTLPWPAEDLEVISEFWGWAREIPVVYGGYFTARHVSNAWNRVVVNNILVRDALEEAVYAINREMRHRQEEYNVTGPLFGPGAW